MTEAKNRNYSHILRRLAQLGFVVFVGYLGLRHQILKTTGGAPPIDNYCPFGAVETFWSYMTTGVFIKKTAMTNFVVFGSLIGLILTTGGSFCSHICPLGTVQEWLGKLGRKLPKIQLFVPAATDRRLRYLRFVVLGVVVYYTARFGFLVFERYDPFKNLFHFKFESWIAYAVVGLTIVSSLAVDRFWCRYLCPLGAVVHAGNKLSLVKISRDEDTCISCERCSKSCVMNIPVADVGKVDHGDCTMCLECVDVCPVEGTLSIKTRWAR